LCELEWMRTRHLLQLRCVELSAFAADATAEAGPELAAWARVTMDDVEPLVMSFVHRVADLPSRGVLATSDDVAAAARLGGIPLTSLPCNFWQTRKKHSRVLAEGDCDRLAPAAALTRTRCSFSSSRHRTSVAVISNSLRSRSSQPKLSVAKPITSTRSAEPVASSSTSNEDVLGPMPA